MKTTKHFNATTHGMSRSVEYRSWTNLKKRCLNKDDPKYQRYGGRGISVCERWLNSFQNYYDDMGKRPSTKHSIDRIDNNGNYEPSNCRWTDAKTQSNNTRRNRKISFNGITKNLCQWAKCLNIPYTTLSGRIDQGNWSIEKALTTPVKAKKEKQS